VLRRPFNLFVTLRRQFHLKGSRRPNSVRASIPYAARLLGDTPTSAAPRVTHPWVRTVDTSLTRSHAQWTPSLTRSPAQWTPLSPARTHSGHLSHPLARTVDTSLTSSHSQCTPLSPARPHSGHLSHPLARTVDTSLTRSHAQWTPLSPARPHSGHLSHPLARTRACVRRRASTTASWRPW
jgi:hypothetical protein